MHVCKVRKAGIRIRCPRFASLAVNRVPPARSAASCPRNPDCFSAPLHPAQPCDPPALFRRRSI